jgi:PAH dioxygenase large subunit
MTIETQEQRPGILTRLREEISKGWIPLEVFSSEELFQLECDKLFTTTWLFLAHESEIPEPGDYVVRYMGAVDPIILVRGEDGKIRAFNNICRHRGMRVCRAEMGNASHFRCTYHGWTYNNKGDLIGVPAQKEAYGDSLDKDELGLKELRIDSFQGLIFGNFDETAPSLENSMGGMKFYLEILTNRTEKGLKFLPPQRWIVKSNWKLAADNFVNDNYHVLTTHRFAIDLNMLPKDPLVTIYGHGVNVGNGNGIGFDTGGNAEFPRPQFYPVYDAKIIESARNRLSSDQFKCWQDVAFIHGNLFPNLGFLNVMVSKDHKSAPIPFITFRAWRPMGPDTTEIWSWFAIEREADPKFERLSYESYIHSFGPSGTFEQDDIENWNSITASSKTHAAKNFSLCYKMGENLTPDKSWPGPGTAYPITFTEKTNLSFYNEIVKYLSM